MRIAVTGATGFIGGHLLPRIEQPVVLTRDRARAERQLAETPAELFEWDGVTPPPPAAFEGAQAVIHLAGESVGEGRWTAEKKKRIRESRMLGTKALVTTLAALNDPPPVLVSASAIGYYGSRGEERIFEVATPGDDFLARVCQDWEQAALQARDAGIRVVNPRIGIVLGREGGALPRMLTPFRWGVGGRLGNGRQWMSWIHVEDLARLLLFLVDQPVEGPVNATAPEPVTNRTFTKTLASTLHRPALFPVPRLALQIALGEFGNRLFDSQRVIPGVATQNGFEFEYPELRLALEDLL